MRQPCITQRRLVRLIDVAARPRNQGAGDTAGTVGQHALNPLGHALAQPLHAFTDPRRHIRRACRHDDAGPAIDKAHRADGLEKQIAAQVGRPRLGRRRGCIHFGGQAQPFTRLKVAVAQRQPHPARRIAGREGARAHIVQHQPHALGARLKADDAPGQMRDQRTVQNRRFNARGAQPGDAEAQQQRRQQRHQRPPPSHNGDHRQRQSQAQRRPAHQGRRLDIQREIAARACRQRNRQP